METRVSTKGQVVLPGNLRRRLGIHPGDRLKIELEGDRIVLTSRVSQKPMVILVEDPVTGIPFLKLDCENPPVLTSKDVEEMLVDFP